MSEHVYESEGRHIIFSESEEDIGCLCTFPHNDFDENQNLVIDESRLLNLALLGCAVCLIHNTDYFKNELDILLPTSLEQYYAKIKECIEKLKTPPHKEAEGDER